MLTINSPNILNQFSCNICNYICSKERDYNKHVLTRKHLKAYDGLHISPQKIPKQYSCKICNKDYVFRQSLYNHKKKCHVPNPANNITLTHAPTTIFNKVDTSAPDPTALALIVIELMKSNQELQKQMLEVCKNSNSQTNSHNYSHNKTFNMQIFLNEQCKDAMNIMEFVDTFKLEFSDLERVGEVGYVEGMSNIIIQKLNGMDIYKRPIHCSDAKRETMFVRDKNVWEKDNETHDKLRLAIKYISKKNTDMLNRWCESHPGSCDSDNYLNDIYMEMVMQSMGGRGSREENENKIMRRIAKTVLINKELHIT